MSANACSGAAVTAPPAPAGYATRHGDEALGARDDRESPMSNMNQMMKQAQALQRKLMKAQEELAAAEVTGSSGGGTVTVVVSGGGDEVKSVTIDPAAVDPDDVEMLQDLVVAAVNDGLRRAKELEQETLGGLTGGMGLPPGLV